MSLSLLVLKAETEPSGAVKCARTSDAQMPVPVRVRDGAQAEGVCGGGRHSPQHHGELRLSPRLTPPLGAQLRCGWEVGERKEPSPFACVI